MKSCGLVLELHLSQFFFSHTHKHTDRHFPEVVNSCSEHSKMCKSIKNWKLKIFPKPILLSIYIKESKNLLQPKLIFLKLEVSDKMYNGQFKLVSHKTNIDLIFLGEILRKL